LIKIIAADGKKASNLPYFLLPLENYVFSLIFFFMFPSILT